MHEKSWGHFVDSANTESGIPVFMFSPSFATAAQRNEQCPSAGGFVDPLHWKDKRFFQKKF